MTRERTGAWCGVGCLQFFVCEQLARLGWPGLYSLRRDYISDLGESSRCAAHGLMNASFFVQAVLIAAVAILLAPGRRFGKPAQAALLASALGLALVATHPADRDPRLHIAGAEMHFLGAALGMLLAGSACLLARRLPGKRAAARAALVFGSVACAGDLLLLPFNAALAQSLGIGVAERLAAYPLPLWLAWIGFQALGRQSLAL